MPSTCVGLRAPTSIQRCKRHRRSKLKRGAQFSDGRGWNRILIRGFSIHVSLDSLHVPPVFPARLIQRMGNLPQRVVLHRLDQLLEHIAPVARRYLQHLEAV